MKILIGIFVVGVIIVVLACCNISGIESEKEEERKLKKEIEEYQQRKSESNDL